jgi:hypothetical protein
MGTHALSQARGSLQICGTLLTRVYKLVLDADMLGIC